MYSQTFKGSVSDSITKEKLAYANLVIKGKNSGTYSNEDGTYNLNLSKASINDTLVVSLIGYHHQRIALRHFLDTIEHKLNFQLLPKIESLVEVLILSKTKIYSNHKITLSTGNRKQVFPTSAPFGYETATLIKNQKQKKGKLAELHLKFRDSSSEIYTTYSTYYRIAFYNIDALGFPGELLHFESIIIKPENDTKNYEIDLEDKAIPFTEKGIFVGIETLKPDHVKQKDLMYITTPSILHTHTKETLKYSRFRSNNWTKHARKSVTKKKLYAVPFIKIKVVYEKE